MPDAQLKWWVKTPKAAPVEVEKSTAKSDAAEAIESKDLSATSKSTAKVKVAKPDA